MKLIHRARGRGAVGGGQGLWEGVLQVGGGLGHQSLSDGGGGGVSGWGRAGA